MTQPGHAPPIRTEAIQLTDVGQTRSHNQDFVAIEIPGGEALQAKGALYLVADGMGGYRAGDVASQKAARAIIAEYYADPQTDIAASLSWAVQKASAAVYHEAQTDQQLAGMGTTVVAAVVRGTEVHIANVGDSRAYLLRGGAIRQITKDHSFVQEQVDAHIITPEVARTHPQRNVITRALGHKPQVQVDTFRGQLSPGDTLLLCSDGLSGPVRDEELADIVAHHSLQQAVTRLIEAANGKGGPDNISAVLVRALPYEATKATAIQLQPGVQPSAPVSTGAAVASTGPLEARPIRPAAAPPARRRGGLIVWGMLGALLVVTALIVLGSLALGGKDEKRPTSTFVPTIALSSATPVPDILPSSTTDMAPEATTPPPTAKPTETMLPATSTPLPTNTPTPTPTPCRPWLPALVAPLSGLNLPPGDVTFQWEAGGLCPGYVWRVIVDGQADLCPATTANQVTCSLTPGEHEWHVELWGKDAQAGSGMMTLSWQINIVAPTEPPSPPTQPQPTQPQPTPTKEE